MTAARLLDGRTWDEISEEKMSEWQTMETAPKEHERVVEAGLWDDSVPCWQWLTHVFWDRSERQWYDLLDRLPCCPTHWREVGAPKNAKGEAA